MTPAKQRGIYITVNDRAIEQAVAFTNSVRFYDADTPIILIPYDEDFADVARLLGRIHNVTVFPDLALVGRISRELHRCFGPRFFARPNQFRKQAVWFGPFEEFLYVDTDIVVFTKIVETLDALASYDFVCFDYQHKGGIQDVFSERIFAEGVLARHYEQDVFNCGFWGAKSALVTEPDLFATFEECAAHREYFDFSRKTSDQPIVNYLVLTRISRRVNLAREPEAGPGTWAGSPHFVREGYRLFDPRVKKYLPYLHWAGIRLESGCPYWELWKHYRDLNCDANFELATISHREKKKDRASCLGTIMDYLGWR